MNLSADYAALGWLFISGIGAGLLSRIIGSQLVRVLKGR